MFTPAVHVRIVPAAALVAIALSLGTAAFGFEGPLPDGSADEPGAGGDAANAVVVDFNRQIRPILSDHCFACHGPDKNALQGDLRLDDREHVFRAAQSGLVPVIAGDVAGSELVRRVRSQDASTQMPPPETGKPLSAEEITLLEQWIGQGAGWSEHWAFAPVQSPSIPREGLALGEIHNPIDAFVLQRLAAEGLAQGPRESRERLIRRASLDLTGLPPTIDEVQAFLFDRSPQAFETVVDRLLGSQHFGERLALPWLDLARYGDTSGYHNDSLRDMWLWRQWVIEAFNANMPFDQFTIEQLAGDLLPAATLTQRVASGFHRNVMTSDEGGLIDAEYRNLYVVDRVATTGVTWLGMTVACAQCHDHKYDPLSQSDFYRLYAFFNNVPENGKDGVRDRNPVPFLSVPTAEQEAAQREIDGRLQEAQQRLANLRAQLPERQSAWEAKLATAGEPPQPPAAIASFPLDGSADGASSNSPAIVPQVQGTPVFGEGVQGESFHTDGTNWFEYGERFGFEKDQPFSVSAFVWVTPGGGSPFGKMDDGNGARGWDVEFHGLRPSVHLIHRWPEDVIHLQADEDLPANTWTHLALTYDGSGKAAGLRLYIDGSLAKATIRKDALEGTIRNEIPFCIGRRGPTSTPFTGRIDELRIDDCAVGADQIAALGAADVFRIVRKIPGERSEGETKRLASFFERTEGTEIATLQAEIAAMVQQRDELLRAIPNTMVMAEMEKPRETFIKVRGNYDADGELVVPGGPAFLPPILSSADPQESPSTRLTRLDLARWLVADTHPLTARVAVNRLWAMLFGTGIVKTLNDFGSQGEAPSHPELLDWLATDLRRDWDIKRVIKQMVMSATYQQSARVSPELLARDAENRLLARGPRQRLDAELIRDNALSIAGILNPRLGGRSIKPAQPAGTWEINEMSGYGYEKSQGDDLYRRGLYVYWRRSTVYPSFVTLDAPTREFCVAQRAKTSTPLQSLVLMNDPVFVEAARGLGQRILSEGEPTREARLQRLWQFALARTPSPAEMAILTRTLAQLETTYQHDTAGARGLAAVGDLPKPTAIDDVELAIWTAMSNMILNLNETITN